MAKSYIMKYNTSSAWNLTKHEHAKNINNLNWENIFMEKNHHIKSVLLTCQLVNTSVQHKMNASTHSNDELKAYICFSSWWALRNYAPTKCMFYEKSVPSTTCEILNVIVYIYIYIPIFKSYSLQMWSLADDHSVRLKFKLLYAQVSPAGWRRFVLFAICNITQTRTAVVRRGLE